MGDITPHFSRFEFTCRCGCGFDDIAPETVEKLEKLYTYLSRTPRGVLSVIVNSGCRCPDYSVQVGGYRTDAHTKGLAADICARDNSGAWYSGHELAAVAEKVGFTGIGVMVNACHVDTRNAHNYSNAHWYGNEITGEDNIKTFAEWLPLTADAPAKKHTITVLIDGVKIIEKEFE